MKQTTLINLGHSVNKDTRNKAREMFSFLPWKGHTGSAIKKED